MLGVIFSGDHSHIMYIIMELADQTLAEYASKYADNTLNPEIIRMSGEIISGLGYLHKSNIVHRDLKPANILLDSNKTIKVKNARKINLVNRFATWIEVADYFLNLPLMVQYHMERRYIGPPRS